MINKITKHITTDPNSVLLAHLGTIWCLSGIIIGSEFMRSYGFTFLGLIFGSLVPGVTIELIKLTRWLGNWKTSTQAGLPYKLPYTFKESMLNVFQTWWFPVTYYILYRTK